METTRSARQEEVSRQEALLAVLEGSDLSPVSNTIQLNQPHSDHLIVFLNVSPANLWNKHKWSLWQQSQVRNAKPNLGPELVTQNRFCQACFCLFNYNHLRNQFFHNFNLMRWKCSFQLAIDHSLLCHIPFLPDNNRVDSDRVLICTDNPGFSWPSEDWPDTAADSLCNLDQTELKLQSKFEIKSFTASK